jgi:hypothetical protein
MLVREALHDFFGHAIVAPEVAIVGEGNPKIVMNPMVLVDQQNNFFVVQKPKCTI